MSDIDDTLALFPTWCVQRELGLPWGEKEQAWWRRVTEHLAAWRPQALLVHELALQLRVLQPPLDEADELDQLVRWWDAARRSGVAVPADFGELWQAYETIALQQQLVALGQACRQKHEHGHGHGHEHGDSAIGVPALAERAAKVALRYGPLKPLTRWLGPLAGVQAGSGFTF